MLRWAIFGVLFAASALLGAQIERAFFTAPERAPFDQVRRRFQPPSRAARVKSLFFTGFGVVTGLVVLRYLPSLPNAAQSTFQAVSLGMGAGMLLTLLVHLRTMFARIHSTHRNGDN